MRFGLLPAKALDHAKTRLAPLLPDGERRAVAVAMFQDVLDALRTARALDGVAVVTGDASLLDLARNARVTAIDEGDPRGLNGAVSLGTARCLELGATSVLVVLSDLPLVKAADLDAILEPTPREPSVRLVRSHEGLGTNALLRFPPQVIPTRFGGRSFRGHAAAAVETGVPYEERAASGIAFDVDTIEDLERLRRAPVDCRTRLLVERVGIGTTRLSRARSLG